MRLADFIETQPALILAEWVAFAASCAPAAVDMTKTELRDHAAQMLGDIVIDLRSYQSESQRKQKASGARTDDHHAETAAEAHGADRAASGFTVEEMASEYRAFRASVIRLWTSANDGLASADVEDLMRFNESIDQALSESIAFHAGESRAADRALFVSEQRYRTLLNEMAEGVLLYDVNLRVTLWNPAAERLLGLTATQLADADANNPLLRFVDHTGKPMRAEDQCAAVALRTGIAASGLMGVDRGDGSRVWMQVTAAPLNDQDSPTPNAVEVTLTDVTTEREATRLLEESEMRYRSLAANSIDLVSRLSTDGAFEYASPSYWTVLGLRSEELIGTRALDLVHPDDAEVLRGRDTTLKIGVDSPAVLVRLRHSDGHYVYIESVARPTVGANGIVVGMQVAERDVSERRALQERLNQAQKMEAMGRMASGVAHDFNNLLTVVRATADLLRVDQVDTGERNKLLDSICESVDLAAQLTAQLLAFSHGQHTAPKAVAIGKMLRNTRALLVRIVGPRIAIALTLTPEAEASTITADPVQIEQVLLNLMMNARDAMPGGGVATLHSTIENIEQPRPHFHGTIAPGTYVVISVTDVGAGMSAEVLSHLFDPFYTTKAQGRGIGMGLAEVFGIVEQAHGAIVVESEVGVGSTVSIYWPSVPSNAPDAGRAPVVKTPIVSLRPVVQTNLEIAAPSAGVGTDSQSSGFILVVDDEEAVRQVVTRLLERDGYRVIAVGSGAEAIDAVQRERGSVRALLSDVRMPGMSGVEMVAALLVQGIDLPVLFMSGQLDAPLPTDWPPTVPRHFMGKPFTADTLAQAMRELLATSAR